MVVITESLLHVGPEALAGRERDTLPLTWEERRWTRKRVRTHAPGARWRWRCPPAACSAPAR